MVKKVIVIGIVLFCIMLLILFAVPATAILGESLFVRWDIDNPYVNHNFDEWNCAYVEGFHAFLIPKEWALQKNDNVYWITNDLGEVWAFGTAFGTEEDCFDNYEDLIATVQNVKTVEIEIDPFNRFTMMDGSDIDLIHVQEGTSTSTYFCIQLLEDAQKEIVWMVRPDITLDETQYDIAEAIIYSFAFEVRERK